MEKSKPLTDAQKIEAANILSGGCLLSSLSLFLILPSTFAGKFFDMAKGPLPQSSSSVGSEMRVK